MSSSEPTDVNDAVPNYHTRALMRGLEILRVFTAAEPELTLTELAERLGLNHSTALRLLDCLKSAGFVELDPQRKVWSLGIATFEVGGVYLAAQRIERLARPYLEALARGQQQTANLGVRDDLSVVHLAVVHPERPLHYQTSVGARDSLHCTALGKVLATALGPAHVDRLIAAGLPVYTPRTITDGEQFRAHLERVRAQGYALDDEERLVGLRCVAAPVTDRSGVLRAALSISGPAAEFGPDQLRDAIRAVRQAADSLSHSLLGAGTE